MSLSVKAPNCQVLPHCLHEISASLSVIWVHCFRSYRVKLQKTSCSIVHFTSFQIFEGGCHTASQSLLQANRLPSFNHSSYLWEFLQNRWDPWRLGANVCSPLKKKAEGGGLGICWRFDIILGNVTEQIINICLYLENNAMILKTSLGFSRTCSCQTNLLCLLLITSITSLVDKGNAVDKVDILLISAKPLKRYLIFSRRAFKKCFKQCYS